MARRAVSEPSTRIRHHVPLKTPGGRDDPNPQLAFVAVARLVSLLPPYSTDKINEGTSGGKLGYNHLARCAPRRSRATRPGSSSRPGTGAKCFCYTYGLVAAPWDPPYPSEQECSFSVSILGPPKSKSGGVTP